MKILGLTGQSGAGKTLFANELAKKGYPYVNADELYHSMLVPPSKTLDAIRREFGDSFFLASGELDRKALAREVFSSKERLNALNATVLPLVIENIRKIADEQSRLGTKLFIIDAPTLFESGLDADCDLTLAIVAPAELRIKRIAERDKISLDDATLRTRAQKSNEFYLERADKTIINDKGESELIKAAEKILSELLEGENL